MRARYEFTFYETVKSPEAPSVDPTLALMGSQGWEIRGIAALAGGTLLVALQRPLDEELPLPDGLTLAASLEEPLTAPASSTL
ncbi:MAG: hypothetical protein IAI50_04810 [Candidatus Eremiobacteraeota bacterium]|nr:hypothetical protein [Candidatus Eremiobacteraeota bacterium]